MNIYFINPKAVRRQVAHGLAEYLPKKHNTVALQSSNKMGPACAY
jgi:hypothetical protein